MTRSPNEATRLIRAGHAPAKLARTVPPAIQKGSTVLLPDAASLYDPGQTTYGRAGLATQETLASALAELECAAAVRLFPSGLAALAGAMLAILETGDDVLVTEDDLQARTRRFCDRVLARSLGLAYATTRRGPGLRRSWPWPGPTTRLDHRHGGLPGSLTFEIQGYAGFIRRAGAFPRRAHLDGQHLGGEPGYFKPLTAGIDISVQALTKYVAGHADIFMGSAATTDPKLSDALDHAIWNFGWAVSPDDAYQVLRGLRTLPTRMARHQASGLTVADWLSRQPQVAEVLHPALPSSPDHELWKRDSTGAGGLFSVVLQPCSKAAALAFLDALELFGLGFSWGGFESLALDADPQFDVRQTPPSFAGPVVRLNIGLEDPEDLMDDLRRALVALAP